MKRVMSIFAAGGLVFSTAAPVFAEDHENSEVTLECGEPEPSISVEELDGMENMKNHVEPAEVDCDAEEQDLSGKGEVVHNDELEAVCSGMDLDEDIQIEDSPQDGELISEEEIESENEREAAADEESLTEPQEGSTEEKVCMEAGTSVDEKPHNAVEEGTDEESEDIGKQVETVVGESSAEEEDGVEVDEKSDELEPADEEEPAELEQHIAEEPAPEIPATDPSKGEVSTASVETNPIIQTDIEIETILPSVTSTNQGSNSNSSGNGNSSNMNGTNNDSSGTNNSSGGNNSSGTNPSYGPNNGSGANHSNSRPTVNHPSGSQSIQGAGSGRLPQTGGVMDQTRMILLSGLMILVGAVLRITSSRKRKFD